MPPIMVEYFGLDDLINKGIRNGKKVYRFV